MPEASKFGGLAELRRKPKEETPKLAPSKPRYAGKRSDPEWKQFSILLKKESHRKAGERLREQHPDVDMSDLLQNLLDQWLATE